MIVIGAKGQLGSELQVLSKDYSQLVFTDREELDLCDLKHLVSEIARINPQFIINCAAHTAVDGAETEFELSDILNHQAVAVLAKWSQYYNCKLLHVSTDYVFDGAAAIVLTETVATNPVNVYVVTKLAGEKVCVQENPNSIIIRTSWVYSSFGNNLSKPCRF